MKAFMKKHIVLVSAIILLLSVAVGSTVAYVFTNTDALVNIFASSKVSCAVVENGTEHMSDVVNVSGKGPVHIKNTGDTAAYIRAAVVVTWKNEKGNVWAAAPQATDYSIVFQENSGWISGSDGFYYYTTAVAPSTSTNNLIASAKQLTSGPVGSDGLHYYLSVEIIASAIQAVPTAAVETQWLVSVDRYGSISK